MKRKAFTLVEMLIVITIVAILAVLAVSSYGMAGRIARLDVVADSIVSTIKDRQLKAKTGVAEERPLCYGVFFSMDAEDETSVEIVETTYHAVGSEGADYCDLGTSLVRMPLDQAEDFKILRLKKFETEEKELLILFKPPFARMVLGTLNYVLPPGTGSPEVLITIGLPQGEGERTVRFNVISNVIERVYESIQK